jgi:hypothetical protein
VIFAILPHFLQILMVLNFSEKKMITDLETVFAALCSTIIGMLASLS